ncbi:MAG: site-2 protease family protein [Gammaproteobacteria bacterium]|nr:MAG: site-2 protease family protein [Gammaproteobacteria bacterium]
MSLILILASWYVVFVFSATVHEAAHAWAAKQGGDLTAYYGGQVSIDPIPHIRREPFGMILLPIISLFTMHWPIGYASAPYDPYWAVRNPRKAALMALAGPASNFVLAIVAMLIMILGMKSGVLFIPRPDQFAAYNIVIGATGFANGAAVLLSMLFFLNLLLGVFNLLPLPPLDGSEAITLFMKQTFLHRYRAFIQHPSFSMFGILIAWMIFGKVFAPVFHTAVGIMYLLAR